MFDAVLSDLGRFVTYMQLYLAHYPERTFLILGATLLVLLAVSKKQRKLTRVHRSGRGAKRRD